MGAVPRCPTGQVLVNGVCVPNPNPSQPQPGTPGSPNQPTPGPYQQNPIPEDPGGTGCDCTAEHRPGTKCWTVCGQTGNPNSSGCPQPGQIRNATGQCACPPGQTIHGTSTRGCEPENGELCDPAAHPAFDSKRGQIGPTAPNGDSSDCYWCDFTTRTWQKGYCPGGSAAGAAGTAGAAGAKAGATTSFGPSAQSSDFAKMLQGQITGDLTAPSRFTPEIMQRLFGAATQQTSSRILQGQRDVRAQAARAGQSSRWGSVQAGLRSVRSGAEDAQGNLNLQIDLQKVNADYTDHTAALDRAQKFLDSMRDNEYRYTLMGEQRRQFDANLTLGYANLAQQRSNLQMQLQSQWDQMRAMQGFLALLQGTGA